MKELLGQYPAWGMMKLHLLADLQADGGPSSCRSLKRPGSRGGIRLFVLPPDSPKLNGTVERTCREEYYECSDAPPTVIGFEPTLRYYEHIYDFVRPRQALGYLTPAQSLQEWAIKEQQEVSHTR